MLALAVCGAGPMLLLAGEVAPAAAHPHVWITDVTTFVFEGRQLVGLRHRWTFDEFFGSFVIEEHDRDGEAGSTRRRPQRYAKPRSTISRSSTISPT